GGFAPRLFVADPILVAAGDIHANCTFANHDQSTASVASGIAGTIAVLGDQTDDGSLAQYTSCYGRRGGRSSRERSRRSGTTSSRPPARRATSSTSARS